MDRKRELKQQYKETPVEAGVFQITNNQNSKIYIGSTKNLKTLNGIKFMLDNKGFTTSKALQTEWNQFGKDAFTFDVLEKLKKNDDPFVTEKEALAELEENWLEKMQPYGERGYNQKQA